jgi:hypothetical protein
MFKGLMIVVFGMFMMGCDGGGLEVGQTSDAGIEAQATVAVAPLDADSGAGPCSTPVAIEPTADPCVFALPAGTIGHDVNVYVLGCHQAGASYVVAGNALTITSAYLCTSAVRGGEILLRPSVLIDCASPPSNL